MSGCLHRAEKPRRCKQRGCKTWLSSYNPDPYCAPHGGWRAKAVDSRLGRESRGDDLADILAVVR